MTIDELAEALIEVGFVEAAAVYDGEEYDGNLTRWRINQLHQILTKEAS
jgi:hypothetical protein